MDDPFFTEDDGDFDDLYGIPSQASSHPLVVRHEPPVDATLSSHQPALDIPSYIQSPAASSGAVSRSYGRDRTDSVSSHATDRVVSSGPSTKWRQKHTKKKTRRRTSQELFNVQWESDVHVATCRLCHSDFSLVKRRHHCRHCGRVMCSDCSCFVYFEFSRRKHRVCATCNNQLLAGQDAYERETVTSSPVQMVPRPCGGGATAGKEVERNARKAEKKRGSETVQQQRNTAMSPAAVTTFCSQTMDVEEKLVVKREPLLDDADGSWFTDAIDRQTHSYGSVEEYSEDGSSKGPGWRDRIKDTYTVAPTTDETSVLGSIAGSTLTSGITGNGYISDQFRYDDVSGPGLGHEDDTTIEMPRPKQQSAALSTFTGCETKHRWVSENDILVEQLEYADLSGPGLGHDDDCSVAMPRPTQLPLAVPYSYESGKRDQRESKQNITPHEHNILARTTIKDVVSAPKRRVASLTRQRGKTEDCRSRARGNQDMTLDELDSSYSSRDESRMRGPTVPIPAAAQPTFYEQDADKLVIDDSPGFFEATIAEREVQHEKDKSRQEQIARDNAWVNKSALPHDFSSEHSSYSIVDRPSQASNSPVVNHGSRAGDAKDKKGTGEKPKSGFTRVFKRFFGMGPKRKSGPPKYSEMLHTVVVSPPKAEVTENHVSSGASAKHRDSIVSDRSVPDGSVRPNVANCSSVGREKSVTRKNSRPTMATLADVPAVVEAPLLLQDDGIKQHDWKQEPERKRRGTFDDLFMSPKDSAPTNKFGDHFGTSSMIGWDSRVGHNLNGGQSIGAVGVARFDQRRPIGEDDEPVLGNELAPVLGSIKSANGSTEAWRESAALSLLKDRRDSTQSSAFTWSSIQSVSGPGTATRAVSTSLQPRAGYNDNYGASVSHKISSKPTSTGGIMDDLKCGLTLSKSQGKTSVDEFFAEFEEANEYVFDSTTGGYVAARVPARTEATRDVQLLGSTELVGSEKHTLNTGDREYDTVLATKNDSGGDVDEDDVAEIIVDKISSLESELAALKQLIRNQKGSRGNQSLKLQRDSGGIAESRKARKESIFDYDSSDEDNNKPGGSWAMSVRLTSEQTRRRPGNKKKVVKQHKDSFAQLFEDGPNEDGSVGGALSYKAEPETGSGKYDFDSDSDSTLPLKRPGKQPLQWKTDAGVEDAIPGVSTITAPSKLTTKHARIREASDDDFEDPIDALFDASSDRDVTTLYSSEDGHDDNDERSVPELSDVLNRESRLSVSDDEMSASTAVPAVNISRVVPDGMASQSYSRSADPQVFGAADEDESFSINWSKVRKTKPRRHKSHHVVGESSVTGRSARLLERSLHAEKLEVAAARDIFAEHTTSTPFLASASSTAEVAEDHSIDLSSEGDEKVELQFNGESQHTDIAEHAVSSSGVTVREPDDPVEQSLLANMVEEPSATTVEVSSIDEAAAAFDIFDKSRDVDVLSMSSLIESNTPDYQDDRSDSSDDDDKRSFSGVDEAFNFEIQTVKKRLPVDALANHPTAQTEREPSEPFPGLLTSMELGEHATLSVPSSSRTPLIDGSLDDFEDASADDDSVLEESVESQAFDIDWQQMQEKEKERKKRRQVKQRQAQRDKLLRKQSRPTKSSSGSAVTHGSSKSKSKSDKKKKKGVDNNDAVSSSLQRKSGSSRMHHQSATNGVPVAILLEPSRTLTDL
uniref:FYVE-type domain-containing protein n=1 Tax=Peronospora matthiolae TaxID=2874970 RepID=A0AAV1T6C4_9STRA